MAVAPVPGAPAPLARSGGWTGRGVLPGEPYVRVTVTSYARPWGATVYGPSAMCHFPDRTGPFRYPGVASSARMKNSLRAPPDQPRKPSPPRSVPRSSKMPMSSALPCWPAGMAGRS